MQTFKPTDNCHVAFDQRCGRLNDPHVRALAWLLLAPDLLDAHAPQWRDKIATIPTYLLDRIDDWLESLDRQPDALHHYLDLQPFARLGRYAEQLMAFFFEQKGVLVAHGVQVRSGKNSTIGEFDFLLRLNERLVHWEFATKFYLLECSGLGDDANYFVGPNLADTLGAKMHKILERQLLLSMHPAAQIHLPEAVFSAQALVKGWLFYPKNELQRSSLFGTSATHCRGFWCTYSEIGSLSADRYAILSRLRWLAPAKVDVRETMNRETLLSYLAEYFTDNTMPVMVALFDINDELALETSRGFVVPDDWSARAGLRVKPEHRSV